MLKVYRLCSLCESQDGERGAISHTSLLEPENHGYANASLDVSRRVGSTFIIRTIKSLNVGSIPCQNSNGRLGLSALKSAAIIAISWAYGLLSR